jgi:hypothetical protein
MGNCFYKILRSKVIQSTQANYKITVEDFSLPQDKNIVQSIPTFMNSINPKNDHKVHKGTEKNQLNINWSSNNI